MAQTLPNVNVDGDWVDINTATGVAVGTLFRISNEGSGDLYLLEQTAEPATSVARGVTLTNKRGGYAEKDVEAGSLKIWAKATSSLGSTVIVQEYS